MEYKGEMMRQLVNQIAADVLSEKTIHAISIDTGLRQETIKKLLDGKGNLQSFGILLDYYAAKFKPRFDYLKIQIKATAKKLTSENNQ